MAWYKTGTVAVTNGSTTVTGTGTNFVSGAQVGEAFQGPDGELYEITAISSATSLTLGSNYGGSTASGQSYAIVPTQSLVADLATDVSTLISDYQDIADNAGAGKFADGSAASPGISFSQDQDTGFFRDTANEIAVSIGGTKIGEFNSSGANFTGAVDIDTSLNVDGTATLDGLVVDGTDTEAANSQLLKVRNSTQGEAVAIGLYAKADNGGDGNSGSITFDAGPDGSASNNEIRFNADHQTDTNPSLTIKGNGDVAFYDAAGSNKRFFWDASTERLGLGTDSPTYSLHLYGADNQQLTLESTDGTVNVGFKDSDTTQISQVGAKGNDLYFATGGSETARLTDDGDLGLGVTAPASRLDVAGEGAFEGLTLKEIDVSGNADALALFVYDTRKDSDGGQWRKRTSHTSWYNEGESNSGVLRSSRKEFPSLAVICVEEQNLTIYDADGPNLHIWRKSGNGQSDAMGYAFDGGTSCAMINGMLIVGHSDNDGSGDYDGIRVIDFVRDKAFWTWNDLNNYKYAWLTNGIAGGAVNEHVNKFPFLIQNGQSIVDEDINAVAMTIKESAPIDPETGLQKPTVAIGTQGGLSIIDHHGVIYDYRDAGNNYNGVFDLEFDGDYIWAGAQTWVGQGGKAIYKLKIKSQDGTYNITSDRYMTSHPSPGMQTFEHNANQRIAKTDTGFAAIAKGASAPLYVVADNPDDGQDSLIAFVGKNYNTGWQLGSGASNGGGILATLCGTDDTNLSGSNLVTNGNFSSATGWNYNGAGNTTGTGWSIGSGVATYSGSGADIAREITLEGGKTYVMRLKIDLSSNSGPLNNISVGFRTSSNSGYLGDYVTQSDLTTGQSNTVTTQYKPNSNQTVLVRLFTDEALSVDEWSVHEAVTDRSTANKGLQIHGSINVDHVETGADLVAYSGFSSSNYLLQPYNPDMDFGTGDFTICAWVKGANTMSTATVASRVTGGTEGWHLYKNTTSATPYAIFKINSNNYNFSQPIYANWTHLAAVRKDKILYLYTNGKLDATYPNSSDVSTGEKELQVGYSSAQNMVASLSGISMLKISKSGASSDQVRYIYETEKALFQEGAAATTFGSDQALDALAYDADTGLLHTGNSDGRSTFRGLRRVENTTSAISQALSASNGLVAEE